MNKNKRERLRRAGWTVGSASEFLGLTEAEAALVELKLTLSRRLKERRARSRLSQGQLAKLLGSSQSRVAKMEAGDPSVSIDLLIRSLLAIGTTRKELAAVIAHQTK
jgi:DNA-binding XRE family transcriptional regulator